MTKDQTFVQLTPEKRAIKMPRCTKTTYIKLAPHSQHTQHKHF